MIQKERTIIRASLEQVWNFIEDPNNLPKWNPKVQGITSFSGSGKEIGANFGILYVMNTKADDLRGEILVREALSRLTFRYSGGQMPQGDYVDEGFILTQVDDTIGLVRTIDIHLKEIPWWVKIIMWIIFKTGKPVGKPYIETLKDLIEQH